MGWPFGAPRAFLTPDSEAWHIETWAWLLDNYGGLQELKQASLVLPTRTFFPSSSTEGHARVLEILDVIKRHAGIEDWPCEVEAQPERAPERLTDSLVLKREGKAMPLGTFGPHGNVALITYDPALLEDPIGLVATLAHEIAHYLLASFPSPPPGGDEMEEFATDLATAAMGFGLFGAITALRFEGGRDGWTLGWRGQGYLHPRDWAFALAVFTSLRDEPIEPLRPWLRDTVFDELKAARRYLTRKPDLLAPLLESA